MLVERKIKELANNKEYNKVFNYFHEDYTQTLRDFLIRHEVDVKEDDCLINYILKTRTFMPKYSEYTIPIANAMYNEQYTEEMKYELLMSTYKTVKEAFRS